ncbi:hypothetical protein ACFX13_034711 [Malus domestica]
MAVHIRSAVVLTFLLMLTSTCYADIINPITHVTIINYLRNGRDLTVHCKSADDDVGVHVIPPNGSFEFHFRPNFWNSTQYYCKFDWEGGSYWFDIYIQLRDKPNCVKNCNWLIIPNGACRQIEGRPDLVDRCYPWNS